MNIEGHMGLAEEWKDIDGYEGWYKISSFGRVRSFQGSNRTTNAGFIKTFPQKAGNYMKVTLSKDGEQKTFRLHRLVAKAFIPNHKNKPHINHKDGNKHNNIVGNLEWCTPSENNIHAYKMGLIAPRTRDDGNGKLTSRQVGRIKKLRAKTKMTERELAAMFGVSHTCIHLILTKD